VEGFTAQGSTAWRRVATKTGEWLPSQAVATIVGLNRRRRQTGMEEVTGRNKLAMAEQSPAAVYALQFGIDQRWDVPLHGEVDDYRSCLGEPMADISGAVATALDQPLDYPAWHHNLLAGDRVAVALDPRLPQLVELSVAVVTYLLDHQVSAGDVQLVVGHSGGDSPSHQRLCRAIAAELADRGVEAEQVSLHQPSATDDTLAYLAADADAEPVYLNRRLFDADVLLPVVSLQDPMGLEDVGGDGLVRWFTDHRTQQRLARDARSDAERGGQRAHRLASQLNWLTGSQLVLGVVHGSGCRVWEIISGQADALAPAGQTARQRIWGCGPAQRAALTLVPLEGPAHMQSWEELASVLHSAALATQPGGAIVVLSQLAQPPGRTVRLLASLETGPGLAGAIASSEADDTLPASTLLRLRSEFGVYVVSRLSRETVEELGLGYIDQPQEIERLSRGRGVSLLLGGAGHRPLASLAEPVAGRSAHG
jgi:hypothetical protein